MVTASERFQAYSPTHVVILGIFVVGAFVVVALGRRQRGTTAELMTRRIYAVALAAVAGSLQVYQFLPVDWSFQSSLPLDLCDFAWMVAVVALWTGRTWATGLLYYWGLTLTIQGIITPSLGQEFPDPRFLGFWAMHCMVVWAALYLTFGVGIRPTWATYRLAVAVTAGWAVVVYTFNVVAATNYGYLNRKPPSASALDLLGPWPGYVAAEVAIVAVAWALMTWPWVAQAAGQRHTTAP